MVLPERVSTLGRDGDDLTCGLWWNDRAAQGGTGELGNDRFETGWQLAFGRNFGRMAAGMSLRHGGTDTDFAVAQDSLRRRATRDDFGLGLRWEASDRVYFDFAGELVRLGDKSTLGDAPVVERSTARSYGLRARGFWALTPGTVLVPVLEHRREERTWDGLGQEDDRSDRLWRLGAGLTWLPDPDHLLHAAIDWRSSRRRDQGDPDAVVDRDRRVFALRLACEARIHALVTLRVASGFEWAHEDWSSADEAEDGHLVPLSAGLAVHVGPCDLDLALANQPPLRPDGSREPWRQQNDSTWMTAGLSVWF